jgi:Flp pilus assembly pilin Flp
MEDEPASPRGVLIGAGVIVMLILLVVVGSMSMFGGEVSTILSKVGSSITTGNVPNAGGADSAADGVDDQGDQVADADPAGRPPELLIIRTGQLEVEVEDIDRATDAASDQVRAVGGYVSASDQSVESGRARASVTYRIPAARWDDALAAIRGMARTTKGLQITTEAVTNQVVDLGARIANLRATEAALQKIMATAGTISDVLKVQDQLTTVRGEIERLVAEKQQLEERAAFGTLTVTFVLPPTPKTEKAKQGWDPASDVDSAAGTLIRIGQKATSAGIWVGIVLAPIGVLLLIAGVIAWRIRGRFARRGDAIAGTG